MMVVGASLWSPLSPDWRSRFGRRRMLRGGWFPRRCIDPAKIDPVKRWTAKREAALVAEIIQGKTTVAEASRAHDLSRLEIEGWTDDARRGMENAPRADPMDILEHYEKQPKDLEESYGEALPELHARKNSRPCWAPSMDAPALARDLCAISASSATRPAPPALMVNPRTGSQSRATSSRLDAPNGFVQLRCARFRHHAQFTLASAAALTGPMESGGDQAMRRSGAP